MRPRLCRRLRHAARTAAVILALFVTRAGSAAERAVLCEEFTNPFCQGCGYAGPAFDRLVDVYPDSFAFIQFQVFDAEYSTPWGDGRWGFYHAEYTPTAVFAGTDIVVGAVHEVDQQYTIYRVYHFLPERNIPTDITLAVRGEPLGGQSYRIFAEVGIEPDGVGKTLRVYVVQVLDHYPPNKPYHRNGFKQAAPTVDIALLPGQQQVVQHDLTFDNDSWANPQNIKIIAWAQAPADSGPATVYQAAVRCWPLISLPDDWDGDGALDNQDNCPRRYNPDQADADGDGVGDVCDNCAELANPDQADADEDSRGDACDNCPLLHHVDQTDSDGDGLGDVCDSCPEVPAPAGADASGRPLGGLDLDCDVDADDLAILARCLAGPSITTPPPGCDPNQFARADVDDDGDVDVVDSAVFGRNFTGPLLSPPIYVGADYCLQCHADYHADWSQTVHAGAYQTLVDGGNGDNYLCLPCHTVGYGQASGFVNIDSTPHLANVQCENCHGPGSNHAIDPAAVPLELHLESEHCGQCHQSCHGLCGENHHPQFEQWSTSKHSTALEDIQWLPGTQQQCLQCHSTDYRLAPEGQKPGVYDAMYDIECVACHDAHGGPNVGQLRLPPWQLCADCHTMGAAAPPAEPSQPQVEVLHGVGGYALNGTPLSGPYTMHWWGIPDECVKCHVHMEVYNGKVDSGHTFLPNLRACQPCHSEQVATMLVAMTHYEVECRLATIARYFDPNDPLYVDPNDLPPSELARYRIARFNYQMVSRDRSFGTHGPDYVRTLLAQAEEFFGVPPWRSGRPPGGGGKSAAVPKVKP